MKSILFSEFTLADLRLKNRFVRSATWEVRATSEGKSTENLAHFLEALARGGIGLIIMGHAYVQANGQGKPRQTGIHRDELIESLADIPMAVKPHECKVVIQISHSGGHTKSLWNRSDLVSPSAFINMYGETSREMTIRFRQIS